MFENVDFYFRVKIVSMYAFIVYFCVNMVSIIEFYALKIFKALRIV